MMVGKQAMGQVWRVKECRCTNGQLKQALGEGIEQQYGLW